MTLSLRHAVRSLGRLTRPVIVLLLVLSQCVATFGYPVVVRAGESVRRCGCKVRGPSQACCCGPRDCCSVSQPIPEPEELACPLCKAKTAAKLQRAAATKPSTTVQWVPGMKSRSCHGDGPLGFIAEFPTMPPAFLPITPARSIPIAVVREHDDPLSSRAIIPPDPPPRRV